MHATAKLGCGARLTMPATGVGHEWAHLCYAPLQTKVTDASDDNV